MIEPGLRPNTTSRGSPARPSRSPAYGSGKPSRVTSPAPFPGNEANQRGSGSAIGSSPANHAPTCRFQKSATRSRAEDMIRRYARIATRPHGALPWRCPAGLGEFLIRYTNMPKSG